MQLYGAPVLLNISLHSTLCCRSNDITHMITTVGDSLLLLDSLNVQLLFLIIVGLKMAIIVRGIF